jgi:hypothetical protein
VPIRYKRMLTTSRSSYQMDALIPPAAVEMLHEDSLADSDLSSWAIEGILEIGKWDTVIDKTKTMITSWKDREC